MDVGVPICIVMYDEEDLGKFENFVVKGGTGADADAGAGTEVVADVAAVITTVTAVAAQVGVEYLVLTPTARHLSQLNNVDATYLQGTGRSGWLTKGDVIAAQDNAVAPPPGRTV